MATSGRGFRFTQSARDSIFKNTPFARTKRQSFFRRFATAAPAVEGAPSQNVFQRLWNSPVGMKTVHFWAPVMKWGVVLAGASDFLRPAEKLSLTQNLALMATGSIWTRWCFVIRPQNMFLAAVNFCLFIVGTVQVSRILVYQRSQSGSTEAALKDLATDVKGTAVAAEKSAEKELKA